MRWKAKVINENLTLEGIGWEESGATIYTKEDNTFDLYSYNYGGSEKFEGNFTNINDAIKEAESWT
jgi:hypothetical protein